MTEKTKNYLGWALIVGIVFTGAAALWSARTYARLGDVNYARSFAVTGEGRVVGVPDIARFSATVITEGGADLAALQEQNVARANALIDFLKAEGVEDEDIATQSYQIEPRYQTSNCPRPLGGAPVVCPPPTIVGYTIRQTVAVKVRDLAKVGELLAGAVERGANSTSGLQFTIDDPAALEAEARAEAIAEAREKAKAVAKAGGFGLGRLIAIDEGGPSPYYNKVGLGGAEMAVSDAVMRAPAPAIEPGSEEVTIQVIARYEIR